MKETVDRSMFHARFKDYERDDQFSPAALDILFDYFEEMEECSGDEYANAWGSQVLGSCSSGKPSSTSDIGNSMLMLICLPFYS
jgi:hypothetical protein